MIRVIGSALTGRSILYASSVIDGKIVVHRTTHERTFDILSALTSGDEFRESPA